MEKYEPKISIADDSTVLMRFRIQLPRQLAWIYKEKGICAEWMKVRDNWFRTQISNLPLADIWRQNQLSEMPYLNRISLRFEPVPLTPDLATMFVEESGLANRYNVDPLDPHSISRAVDKVMNTREIFDLDVFVVAGNEPYISVPDNFRWENYWGSYTIGAQETANQITRQVASALIDGMRSYLPDETIASICTNAGIRPPLRLNVSKKARKVK